MVYVTLSDFWVYNVSLSANFHIVAMVGIFAITIFIGIWELFVISNTDERISYTDIHKYVLAIIYTDSDI